MISVTINFGMNNSLTRDFNEGITLGQIVEDPNIMAALGLGSNIVAKIDGVAQDLGRRAVDGDEIDCEVRANTKA